nr:MAG TPA: hypothetical protein [Caudoviricetes sp.]
MERLTKRATDGQAIMDCEKCKADWTGKHGKSMVDCTPLYCRNRLKDRLAAYEETGLTPEQCESAKNIIDYAFSADTSKAERIRELLKADKSGRLVVLPCKVGDTVYFRTYDCNGTVDLGIQPHKVTAIVGRAIVSGRYTDAVLLPGQYGVSWFLTREEAEEVLEAMKDGN